LPSKNSTSSNNNNNDQNQVLELVNAKWALEEKYYKETLMKPIEVYNQETKHTRLVRQSWPRSKPVEQVVWEKFYTKLIDPETGLPYEQKDTKDREVLQPDGLGPIRHYITSLIRYRDYNNKEYTLTQGSVFGFDHAGDLISHHINKPESLTQTLFDTKRKYDPKQEAFSTVTTSIIGVKQIYTYLFSKENIDSIIKYNVINENTPKVYTDKMAMRGTFDFNDPVSFVAKSHKNNEAHAVEGKTFQEKLDRFKSLSFEELFEWKYLKENNKDKPAAAEDKEDDNNKGSTNSSSVNNTQHFK
jgi:hypothetical protein